MAKSGRKSNKILTYVRDIASHHFPGKKISVHELSGGLTNHVFEARTGRKSVIVRLSEEQSKINSFLKEQWCVAKARENKIPVPEILEVGNDIVPCPYMIIEKLNATEATHHPGRLDIIEESGRLVAQIHRIPTEGFGHLFDWSQNALSKKSKWNDYLNNEFKAKERIDLLAKNKLVSRATKTTLLKILDKVLKWRGRPCLHHGDVRLKNIMVDKQGKILAIIDWEQSLSSIGPYWDLSISLHDLSVDAQQRFLTGYGLKGKDIMEKAEAVKFFNILNYSPVMAGLLQNKKRNNAVIEHYKSRLRGSLDLFSV